MRTMLGVLCVVLSFVALPLASAQSKPKKQLLPNGTVKSVSATSVVVTGKDVDRTFSVDAKTQVVGKGIGTKSRAAAGKPTIVDVIKPGDRVTLTYQDAAGILHALKIEVTAAATK